MAVDGIIPNFQPTRKNLYRMTLQGIPAWTIKACARPQASIGKQTIDYLNIKRHYSDGKLEWQDMPITLIDPINPSSAQAVTAWLKLHHQSTSGRAGYASMYKKNITIEILGPALQVVEMWQLYGCHINGTIDFGNLQYSATQMAQVSFSVSIDRAELIF